MPNSESIDQLAAALVAAQIVMPNALMNKVNPRFGSKYADLTALREASLAILNAHGLAISHAGDFRDGKFVMVARLLHVSGQWIESLWPMPPEATPQAYGSASTYAKRYTWAGLLGISSDEDDDANAAEAEPPKPRKATSKPPDPPANDNAPPTVAAPAVAAPANPATGKVEPHAIALKPTNNQSAVADQVTWSQSFLAGLASAQTDLEISGWERANAQTLVEIGKAAPGIAKRLRERTAEQYERVRAAGKQAA